ncbi:MAG: type II secretion system protein GspG [Alphaproteobacteria bacterium]|nr:type II secretion system protein GspG [Alphaproteobacteria bacterium]
MTSLLTTLQARLAALRAARVPTRRARRGMTLMEVMIVIAIILLLMGVLTFGLASMFGEAQGDAAGLMIQRIDQKVKIYKVKKRKLPDSLDEVYRGEEVPKDPWGNSFVYRKSGGKDGYDIISYGADGKEGGDDDVKLSDY